MTCLLGQSSLLLSRLLLVTLLDCTSHSANMSHDHPPGYLFPLSLLHAGASCFQVHPVLGLRPSLGRALHQRNGSWDVDFLWVLECLLTLFFCSYLWEILMAYTAQAVSHFPAECGMCSSTVFSHPVPYVMHEAILIPDLLDHLLFSSLEDLLVPSVL